MLLCSSLQLVVVHPELVVDLAVGVPMMFVSLHALLSAGLCTYLLEFVIGGNGNGSGSGSGGGTNGSVGIGGGGGGVNVGGIGSGSATIHSLGGGLGSGHHGIGGLHGNGIGVMSSSKAII